MPRHNIFHTVIFILAFNFLTDCPYIGTLVDTQVELNCSISSHGELKKKYCPGPIKICIDQLMFTLSGQFISVGTLVDALTHDPLPVRTSTKLSLIKSVRLLL